MKKLGTAAVLACGLMLQSQTASANLINITSDPLPGDDVTVVRGDKVAARSTSMGADQLYGWLWDQWDNWNASADGFDPKPAQPEPTILASGESLDGVDFSEWEGEYLVVRWGLGQAGKLFDKADKPNGGFVQAFHIASGDENDLVVPKLARGDAQHEVGGLAFWRVYDPNSPQVPETASTFALFGFALGALVLIHRQRPTQVPVRK